MLFGAAFLIIPGVGPVVAAGSIVIWIIAALEGLTVACSRVPGKADTHENTVATSRFRITIEFRLSGVCTDVHWQD